ncbi:MAG: cyclase family protein [Spirochaetes bacterium]|nr:cyclase family protein [Spirochaetota bacterium]
MIINLSHIIHEEMPVFPGSDRPVITNRFSIEKNGFSENSICLLSHTGTHIDAPAHLIPGGRTLDRYDISKFKGKAFLIDLNNQTGFTENNSEISLSDFIIFRTGWHQYWGEERYFESFPVPSQEMIEFCCSLKLKGVGIDTPSIDRIESVSFENHRQLFASDMIIIENLNNLSQLKQTVFELTALPLTVINSDGFSATVIAEHD